MEKDLELAGNLKDFDSKNSELRQSLELERSNAQKLVGENLSLKQEL